VETVKYLENDATGLDKNFRV